MREEDVVKPLASQSISGPSLLQGAREGDEDRALRNASDLVFGVRAE